MASTRKRPSSGFSSEEKTEEEEIKSFVEDTSTKIIEMLDEKEEAIQPFVEQEIIPTPDPGPRFVELLREEEIISSSESEKMAPVSLQLPKRHPRNIPKFSRSK